MTDITDAESRTSGLGLIGAAGGAGIVFGPALGGILARVDILLPFYAPAALAAVNLVLAALFLPESKAARPAGVGLTGAMRTLVPTPLLVVASTHDNRTRLYLYLFFHLFAAFSALEAMFPLYAERRLAWDALGTGLFLGYLGVVMGVTQGLMVGRLARIVGEVPLVMVGLSLTGAAMVMLARSHSVTMVVLLGFAIAVGNGLYLPSFTSLYSKNCGAEHESGEYLAHSQSMLQTGRGIGFLWGGWALERINVDAPFLLGGLGVLAGLAVFISGLRYLVPGHTSAGQREHASMRYSPGARGVDAEEE
jgi:MFS family permease